MQYRMFSDEALHDFAKFCNAARVEGTFRLREASSRKTTSPKPSPICWNGCVKPWSRPPTNKPKSPRQK
jgi:hypothetical protein